MGTGLIMNAFGPGSSVSLVFEMDRPHFTLTSIKSTIGVICASLANEGSMLMFKGWLPAWSRLQPTTIPIFLILEQLKSVVDWKCGSL